MPDDGISLRDDRPRTIGRSRGVALRTARAQGSVDRVLSTFLTDLDQAESWDDAWRKTLTFFEDNGVSWIVHGYSRMSANAPFKQHLVSTFPEWFQDYFDQSNAVRVDPTARYATEHVKPAFSGPDFVSREREGDEVWRHYEVIRSFGANSGLVVPLRLRVSEGFGGILLVSKLSGSEFTRMFSEHGHSLYVAAVCADAKLMQIKTREDIRAIHLTPREIECLLWLSAGLRNDRIAERLKISNATVELHLANARRKLEAATREQALARAILLGLVQP